MSETRAGRRRRDELALRAAPDGPRCAFLSLLLLASGLILGATRSHRNRSRLLDHGR